MYEIFRTGKIKLNLEKTNQCGYEGQNTFEYRITVKGENLDGQGFLVDTDKLHTAAQSFAKGRWQGACEELAESIAYKIHEINSFKIIRVEIQPRKHGFVSYEYDRDVSYYPKMRMHEVLKAIAPPPIETAAPVSNIFATVLNEPEPEPERRSGC